jgi:hypothetical protein
MHYYTSIAWTWRPESWSHCQDQDTVQFRPSVHRFGNFPSPRWPKNFLLICGELKKWSFIRAVTRDWTLGRNGTVASGGSASCRPLELVNSSPAPLSVHLVQVLVLTVASKAMATNNQKSRAWVEDILGVRLRMSNDLYGHLPTILSTAVLESSLELVPPSCANFFCRQCLCYPASISSLSLRPCMTNKYWPDLYILILAIHPPLLCLGNSQLSSIYESASKLDSEHN